VVIFGGGCAGRSSLSLASNKRSLGLWLWDGSGLLLVAKRLERSSFRWPRIANGVMRLTSSQLSALLEGMSLSSEGVDPGCGSVTSSLASNFVALMMTKQAAFRRDRQRLRRFGCWISVYIFFECRVSRVSEKHPECEGAAH